MQSKIYGLALATGFILFAVLSISGCASTPSSPKVYGFSRFEPPKYLKERLQTVRQARVLTFINASSNPAFFQPTIVIDGEKVTSITPGSQVTVLISWMMRPSIVSITEGSLSQGCNEPLLAIKERGGVHIDRVYLIEFKADPSCSQGGTRINLTNQDLPAALEKWDFYFSGFKSVNEINFEPPDLAQIKADKERQEQAEALRNKTLQDERVRLNAQRRISIEGDDSTDDRACKARHLSPSTPKYEKCREELAEKSAALRRKKTQQESNRRAGEEAAALKNAKLQDKILREKGDGSEDDLACKKRSLKPTSKAYETCRAQLVSAKEKELEIKKRDEQAKIGDGSPEHQRCFAYGFVLGTPAYSECRLKLQLLRQQSIQAQQDYDLRMQAYQQQKAEVEKARAQEEKDRLVRLGLSLLGGQSFSNAAREMNNLPPIPSQPTVRNTTLIGPNGQVIQCTAVSNVVNCQ